MSISEGGFSYKDLKDMDFGDFHILIDECVRVAKERNKDSEDG